MKDAAGVVRNAPVCTSDGAAGAVTGTYTVQPDDPVSNAAKWTFTLQQFTDTGCSVQEKTGASAFDVAKAAIYADSGRTIPQNTFGARATAYLTVPGVGQGKDNFSTTWILPSGGISCANTGGSDRPDSDSSGVLPKVAASPDNEGFLKYPPNTSAAGANWNRQSNYDGGACQAFGSSNQGTWKLTLQKDSKHFVTLTGFSVNTTPPTISINDVSRADGNSGTISFDFTVSLSAAPGQTVTVNYATADGTATTADNDYVATSGTLTFGPDETSKSISVTVNGDTKFESDGAEFRSGPSMVEASASDSGATRRSHSLSTKATRYSGPNNSDLRIRSRVTAASCPPWETAGKIRS